jgi:hypothetical protein
MAPVHHAPVSATLALTQAIATPVLLEQFYKEFSANLSAIPATSTLEESVRNAQQDAPHVLLLINVNHVMMDSFSMEYNACLDASTENS